jgi:hypothetical protein
MIKGRSPIDGRSRAEVEYEIIPQKTTETTAKLEIKAAIKAHGLIFPFFCSRLILRFRLFEIKKDDVPLALMKEFYNETFFSVGVGNNMY